MFKFCDGTTYIRQKLFEKNFCFLSQIYNFELAIREKVENWCVDLKITEVFKYKNNSCLDLFRKLFLFNVIFDYS